MMDEVRNWRPIKNTHYLRINITKSHAEIHFQKYLEHFKRGSDRWPADRAVQFLKPLVG
jgi:hypothetical protein